MPEGTGNLVIVSGAGGALGSRIAGHFAGTGRPVLAIDRQFSDENDQPNTHRETLELADRSALRDAIAAALSKHRAVGLLVNAVGRIWNEPVISLEKGQLQPHSSEGWTETLDSNLTAAFIVANEVALQMARTGGGSIVNFSSIAAQGNVGQVAYAAAKAGIEGMTQTMAAELGPLDVRVNAVALGFVDVPTTRANVPEDQLSGHVARTPLGRLGGIDDLIGAIEFLETNQFVNGAIVKLDGGLRL